MRVPKSALFALTVAFAAQGRAEDAPAAQAAPAPQAAPAAAVPAADAQGFRRMEGGLLEFHARGLDVAEAFAQLRRLMKRNIVVAPDVKARFTGDLYDVTMPQAMDAICRSAGLMAREDNGFVYIEPASVQCRLIRLSNARAADLIPMLQPLLSPRGKISATGAAQKGIKASQDDSGGDDYASCETIMATDLPANLDVIVATIRGLDQRPREILLEATIMAATVDDTTSLGVEFKSLAGVDFRQVQATSVASSNLTLGQLPPAKLDAGTANLSTDMLSSLAKGGLSFGILKNDVAAFVKALQTVTDVHVMANPKVMVLNKQRGEVIVGRRDGYLTTTTTQTSTEQKVEFLETGTRLLFRPFIGEDGMVRLEIHPEDSNGGVTPQGLPFKETVEVTTNVLVPDGETIVIGGLFRERRTETQNKVPLLGDIPLVGNAFRSTTDQKVRQEIIILLTPRIVTPGTAARAEGDSSLVPDAPADEGSGVVVVDPDAERRRFAQAESSAREARSVAKAAEAARAEAERRLAAAETARDGAAEAARADAERLLREALAARDAATAEAAKALAAANAAAETLAEQRRRADAAARTAAETAADAERRAQESDAAGREADAAEAEAAELTEKLAKAAEAARVARLARAAKAAEAAEAARRAERAKAEDAERAADVERAAQAAEEARRAAEAAEAARRTPPEPRADAR